MTALGMNAPHCRIADFKFTHNFIVCNRLPDTEIIFGIDIQKKFSLSYGWDKEKNCYIQRDGRFLTYNRNWKQKATIGIVKSTLKIPPGHNGIIPIKIKGLTITGHMAYFFTDQDSTKGRDPNINIKGEYVGHLEPALQDNNIPFHDHTDAHSANRVTTQWMMAEHIKPDTFDPHTTP